MATVGLRERVATVQQRIAKACERCGRDPSTVTLIAVTKGVGAPTIHEAVTLGLNNFGENRVQEARAKQLVLGSGLGVGGSYPEPRTLNPEPVKWHMIGHLQRNKAKDAVELFDSVHSLDTADLAEALERHAAARNRLLDVFVQVNVSGEATKFGCQPDETRALVRQVSELLHLRVRGLMTMAPFAEDPETVRPIFRRLRTLRDDLTSHFSLPTSDLHLSIGMSQDFEVAIEEGADYIRVGTALFGT